MSSTRNRITVGAILVAIVAVLAVVLAGGGTDPASGAGIDRAYTADMVPHHKSAVEMAKIAKERSKRPEIQRLADDIIRTQSEEVSQMTGIDKRLADAGAKKGKLGGGGMGKMGMEDVGSLRTADPFDRAFIDMMIPHHQSAIEMSRIELARGEDDETKALAEGVIAAQAKEIKQMNEYRQAWFGAPSPAGGVPADPAA